MLILLFYEKKLKKKNEKKKIKKKKIKLPYFHMFIVLNYCIDIKFDHNIKNILIISIYL